jgi:hypothetical protein
MDTIRWFWETWGVPGMVSVVVMGTAYLIALLRGVRDDVKTIGERLDKHEEKDESVQLELAKSLEKMKGRLEGMPERRAAR